MGTYDSVKEKKTRKKVVDEEYEVTNWGESLRPHAITWFFAAVLGVILSTALPYFTAMWQPFVVALVISYVVGFLMANKWFKIILAALVLVGIGVFFLIQQFPPTP